MNPTNGPLSANDPDLEPPIGGALPGRFDAASANNARPPCEPMNDAAAESRGSSNRGRVSLKRDDDRYLTLREDRVPNLADLFRLFNGGRPVRLDLSDRVLDHIDVRR